MSDQIYHILIKKDCGHKCPLCCNRLYDLDNLPSITGEQPAGRWQSGHGRRYIDEHINHRMREKGLK